MTDQPSPAADAPENPATIETPSAASSDAPPPAAPAAPAAAEKPAGGDPAPAGGDAPPAAAEDVGELQKLREMLAGGDEGILKGLERYKSVEAISKAFREARVAAKSAGKPITLSDKATPEEVKAYREAHGIPEEAAAYPGDFRQDFKATDADKAILGEFKAAMHGKNVPPAAAAAALEWYQDFATAQQQALDGNMAKVARETQQALRTEWGGEYDGNIGAATELMKMTFGEDGFNDLLSKRFADGSRLQDHVVFVKGMAQLGVDYYGSNAIFNGDIETTAKTAQEKLDELMKLRLSDPEKYKSDAVQKQVTSLYAQLEKINARK